MQHRVGEARIRVDQRLGNDSAIDVRVDAVPANDRVLQSFSHSARSEESLFALVVRERILEPDPDVLAERIICSQVGVHGQILSNQRFPSSLEADRFFARVVAEIVSAGIGVQAVATKVRKRSADGSQSNPSAGRASNAGLDLWIRQHPQVAFFGAVCLGVTLGWLLKTRR